MLPQLHLVEWVLLVGQKKQNNVVFVMAACAAEEIAEVGHTAGWGGVLSMGRWELGIADKPLMAG